MIHLYTNIIHRLQGFYQLTVLDKDGNIKEQTPIFPNLITNAGLDQIATTGSYGMSFGIPKMIASAFVGTGNTPPTINDTTMTSYLASVGPYGSGAPTSNNIYVAGPPAYWTQTWTYTFGTGAAAGNLTEVGVGYISAAGPTYTLFSHALIVDGAGNPTTLTVLSTDQLILTYTLRNYINLTDQTGSVLISGITYTLLWRPMLIGTPVTMAAPVSSTSGGSVTMIWYQGPIGTNTGQPSGTSSNANDPSYTFATYTNGTFFQQVTGNWGVTVANLSGGLGALAVTTPFHKYQMSFSPKIPKTSANTLSFTINFSWTTYP